MFMAFCFKKVTLCTDILRWRIWVWELISVKISIWWFQFWNKTSLFSKEGMFPLKSSQQWVNVWIYREINGFCFVIPVVEWKMDLLLSHCMVLLFYGTCWSACEGMCTRSSEKQSVHYHTGYGRRSSVSVCVDLLENLKCQCWRIYWYIMQDFYPSATA